jgi:hypothetical protein
VLLPSIHFCRRSDTSSIASLIFATSFCVALGLIMPVVTYERLSLMDLMIVRRTQSRAIFFDIIEYLLRVLQASAAAVSDCADAQLPEL